MKSIMRCPNCNGILRRLTTSSEPEGIRKDAQCRACKRTFAVTKSGFMRLHDTPRT